MRNFTNINEVMFWCQNIIPTVVDDSLSYLEAVYRMKQILVETIEAVEVLSLSNEELKGEYIKTQEEIKKIQDWIDEYLKGNTIPDGSITIEKLADDVMSKIGDVAVEAIYNVAKFLTFGLSDDGYFVAYIPESWEDVELDTSEKGELILRL